MNNRSPCLDCQDRDPPCWGKCEVYLAWRTERDKTIKSRYEDKKRSAVIDSVQYSSRKKKGRK